jgi:hypothetical protein
MELTINATLESGPRWWARIPGMRLSQTCVSPPHDLLQLPELAEESRIAVVDPLSSLIHLGVNIALNVPDAIGKSAAFCASDFLLLEAPLGKLYLMREKSATSHDVNKPELRLDGSEALLRLSTLRVTLDNLDAEEVICITLEALVTVGRNLLLPVGLGDGSANIVRVQTTVSGDVVEPDDTAILDIVGAKIIPSLGAGQVRACVVLRHDRQSLILHDPDVVLILVGVQSDLLLLATGGVHVAVRVKVTALCVPVAERNAAAVCNIGWNVLHALGVQCGLELGGHEAITVTRVDQADEMNREHGHIEGDWDNDQAEQASKEVLEPETGSGGPRVSEQDPELHQRQAANPCDCEQTNPLDTSCSSKTKTSLCQPEPPRGLEGLLRALLVLVCEGGPCKRGPRSEDDER